MDHNSDELVDRDSACFEISYDNRIELTEVNDAIQALMSMDVEELKTVLENPKATILELTIATAMLQSLKKGSLYSMETLLTRVYGKPKETQEVTQDSKIEVVFVTGKTIL